MQTLFIIRFGTPQPVRTDAQVIKEFGQTTANGMPLGSIGIISLIQTAASPEEVARRFREAADENSDNMPVVVGRLDQCGIDLSVFGFNGMLQAFQQKIEQEPAQSPTTKCNLSLDELLDIVSTKGVKGLTSEESTRLQELSK